MTKRQLRLLICILLVGFISVTVILLQKPVTSTIKTKPLKDETLAAGLALQQHYHFSLSKQAEKKSPGVKLILARYEAGKYIDTLGPIQTRLTESGTFALSLKLSDANVIMALKSGSQAANTAPIKWQRPQAQLTMNESLLTKKETFSAAKPTAIAYYSESSAEQEVTAEQREVMKSLTKKGDQRLANLDGLLVVSAQLIQINEPN